MEPNGIEWELLIEKNRLIYIMDKWHCLEQGLFFCCMNGVVDHIELSDIG